MYEFRNFHQMDVGPYRNWLHGRADYFNTETYPGDISPWEMGSKWNHLMYVLWMPLAFLIFGCEYVSA